MNNRHYMANEYKELCADTNDYSWKVQKRGESTNGWIIVDRRHDTKSNFKGTLYYKNGQYALCFAGTDFSNRKDIGTAVKLFATGKAKQIKDAQKFAKDIYPSYP